MIWFQFFFRYCCFSFFSLTVWNHCLFVRFFRVMVNRLVFSFEYNNGSPQWRSSVLLLLLLLKKAPLFKCTHTHTHFFFFVKNYTNFIISWNLFLAIGWKGSIGKFLTDKIAWKWSCHLYHFCHCFFLTVFISNRRRTDWL